MKKTLIITLALVFVLGITGAAFAAPANPFVDVPANHWAYSAVSKLAKDGVIDGMGDGTYQGGRSITRYEMAQMVAKAMVNVDKADAGNRAIIKKLEAEFATELNNLGVRVKALENRVGTVRVSGDARIRYRNLPAEPGNNTAGTGYGNQWQQRFRINMHAQVNENTSFYGRFMGLSHNEWGTTGTTASDKAQTVDANFTTKNIFGSGAALTAGRYSIQMGKTLDMADSVGMVDGAKVTFGNQWKTTLAYVRFATSGAQSASTTAATRYSSNQAAYIMVDGDINKNISMNAMYLKDSQKAASPYGMEIYGLGLAAKLGGNFRLIGDYFMNGNDDAKALNNNSTPKFYAIRLAYKGANRAVPQSWGAFFEYRKVDPFMIDDAFQGASWPSDNVKGYVVSASVALAKNIVMDGYYTFNDKRITDGAKRGNFTRLQVNYFF